MLIKENQLFHKQGLVFVMSEALIVAASMRGSFLEIAKQAAALGSGLQSVAPAEKLNTPNNSVQYLLSVSESLFRIAEACEKLLPASPET